MKRFCVLPALLLFFSIAHAQDEPSVIGQARRFPPQTGRRPHERRSKSRSARSLRSSTSAQRAKGISRNGNHPEQSSGPQFC